MGVVIMRDMVMIIVLFFCYNNVLELVVWEL